MQKNLTRNNIILLTCQLIFILLFPIISEHRVLFKDLILSAVVISGIFALEFSKSARKILLICGAVTLFVIWFGHFFAHDLINIVSFLILFSFNFFIVMATVSHIAKSRHVTAAIIISSVNGYLLLGILGSLLLATSEQIQKFVFHIDTPAINFAGATATGYHDYIYFSFVTLSTLGYGDITPVSQIAKSVTLVIAISGQMYLTILIAMLVGKYLIGIMSR
jgi:hypothetical protein